MPGRILVITDKALRLLAALGRRNRPRCAIGRSEQRPMAGAGFSSRWEPRSLHQAMDVVILYCPGDGTAWRGAALMCSGRTVQYIDTRAEEEPTRAYDLLAKLASEEINLLAFSAIPFGPNHVERTIFPDRSQDFQRVAEKLGW